MNQDFRCKMWFVYKVLVSGFTPFVCSQVHQEKQLTTSHET